MADPDLELRGGRAPRAPPLVPPLIRTIPDGKEVYNKHYDCHGPVNRQNGAASPTTLHPRRGRHSLHSALDTRFSGHK